MAETSESPTHAFIFTWRIENFSFSTHSYQEPLDSSICIADSLDNTEWFLRLYPRGRNLECHIPCFLRRAESDDGPETVSIDYKLFLINADGTQCFTREITNHSFKKFSGFGFPDFLQREDVIRDKELYLPGDTLTIQCQMWKHGTRHSTSTLCTVCSLIKVETRHFSNRITDFSTRRWENKLSTSAPFGMKGLPKLNIVFFLPIFDEFLNISIDKSEESDSRPLFVRCQVSLMDSDGKHRDSKSEGHFFQPLDRSWQFPPFITRRKLTANPNLYLQNDMLCLNFDLSISCGSISENIMEFVHGKPIYNLIATPKKIDIKERHTLQNDIHRLYTKQKFCDVFFLTKTKYLLAHKAVICSRSAVFSELFENDDKVKESGVIEILDSNPDAVSAMIRFMYTDVISDAPFDTVIELYLLGYKYSIFSLTDQCTAMLKHKINVKNVCDALVLADSNQDPVIKQVAQDFICRNTDDTFRSEEWRRFMSYYSQLAGDIMFQVCLTNLC